MDANPTLSEAERLRAFEALLIISTNSSLAAGVTLCEEGLSEGQTPRLQAASAAAASDYRVVLDAYAASEQAARYNADVAKQLEAERVRLSAENEAAHRIFAHFATVSCVTDVLGDDGGLGCECIACASKAWLAARSTTEDTP